MNIVTIIIVIIAIMSAPSSPSSSWLSQAFTVGHSRKMALNLNAGVIAGLGATVLLFALGLLFTALWVNNDDNDNGNNDNNNGDKDNDNDLVRPFFSLRLDFSLLRCESTMMIMIMAMMIMIMLIKIMIMVMMKMIMVIKIMIMTWCNRSSLSTRTSLHCAVSQPWWWQLCWIWMIINYNYSETE